MGSAIEKAHSIAHSYFVPVVRLRFLLETLHIYCRLKIEELILPVSKLNKDF